MKYTIYCDGACRPNPGQMAIGAVLYRDETEIYRLSKFLGEGTNNIAEYRSLIEALGCLIVIAEREKKGAELPELTIRMDSELVVKQIDGRYGVNDSRLTTLYTDAKRFLQRFKWNIEHVRRDKNVIADGLANEAYGVKKK